METSDVRKLVLQTLDRAKRNAASHRTEADAAARSFEQFLPEGVAVLKQVANVLQAEGHKFSVQTPEGLLRLALDRSTDDYVEFALDTVRRPAAVVVRTRLTRGRRVIDHEAVVVECERLGEFDEHRLLDVLLAELEPFVAR